MLTVDIIERYNRGTRLFHAAIYLGVLAELISGWWFVLGNYRPSVIEELTGIGDGWIHEYAGLALILVAVVGAGGGWRAVRTFAAESLRFRASDVRWFLRWPRSVVTVFDLHRWSAVRESYVPARRVIRSSVVRLGGRLLRTYDSQLPERTTRAGVDRAAGTDRSGGYAIGAGSAEPGNPGPDAGLGIPGVGSGPRWGEHRVRELTNIVAFVVLAATYSFTVAYGYVEPHGHRGAGLGQRRPCRARRSAAGSR